VVRMEGAGGQVDGEIRSIEGSVGNGFARVAASEAAHNSRWHAVRIAVAAFGLMLMLSIGVLTFAEEQLDDVTATLADHFGRSAWYGFVAEIALLPALLVMIVALAITIIGVVAIPFAIIGFVVLAVGAAALGFMAVAEASGTSILRSGSQASLTARGAQLRAIVTGISIFGGLWVLTAIVGADFMLGTIIRAIVLILTAVAVTVGFGAVVLWRLEMRRAGRMAKKAIAELPASDAVWQTPTPVAGVAAARRPTPAGAAPGVPASPQMPSSPPAASRSAE
jgi:MFS family permease